LAKLKYTFEDWLADVQYHQPSLRVDPPDFKPDFAEEVLGYERVKDPDYIHPSETLAGQNYLIHNLPESLHKYGFMDDAELQKVIDYRKRAYRKALDLHLKDVEAYVNRNLKRDNTLNQILIRNRIDEIERFFNNADPKELQRVIADEIPQLLVDGSKCLEFLESGDINLVMHALYNSRSRPEIESGLPGYKRYPSIHLLLRALFEERCILLSRFELIDLSAETILDKFEELTKDGSASQATERLGDWLVNELKLTIKFVEEKYGITIDQNALRQRLHRRRKQRKQIL
jgi:hypothetical protein